MIREGMIFESKGTGKRIYKVSSVRGRTATLELQGEQDKVFHSDIRKVPGFINKIIEEGKC